MDEEDDKLPTFEYFNSDINLLVIRILIEGFYRDKKIFSLDQFFKGEYWKIEEITDEIRDTQDYSSVEDLVIHQVFQILRDTGIGKIKSLYIENLSGLREQIVREMLNLKEYTENEVMYYDGLLGQIVDLEKKSEEQKNKRFEENSDVPSYFKDNYGKVFLNTERLSRDIPFISDIMTSFIEFEIEFNAEKVAELNQEIADLLENFSRDDYFDKMPAYKTKRSYFSKQLESFYSYIKNLPVVQNSINIPFSTITRNDFEIIKILAYLEKEQVLKVRSWDDVDLWNVIFKTTPITFNLLLGKPDMQVPTTASQQETKLNLSFSNESGILTLSDQNGKEYPIKIQGQVQKEVMRAIFRNPKDIYSVWSLYEISDFLGKGDANEVAVKNAIYQFNRKVRLSIPEVENIFELTKHTAQLNQKYVNKN